MGDEVSFPLALRFYVSEAIATGSCVPSTAASAFGKTSTRLGPAPCMEASGRPLINESLLSSGASRTASLTFARSRRSSGGRAITASWRHQSSACFRPAFPPIPTKGRRRKGACHANLPHHATDLDHTQLPRPSGQTTARTRVLRIHQVNRTREKLDWIGIQLSVSFRWGRGLFSFALGSISSKSSNGTVA